jgi:glycosyltransferase involved in cell wall biosynthesis
MMTLHVSVSLSRAAGGIFEIELALAKELSKQGVGVKALGLQDAQWETDQARWAPITVRAFPTSGPRAFGYAPGMLDAMIDGEADLAHLHYMWMYPSVAITQWAARTGKPYVVTPNGMLEPWALGNSAWKKKLAGFLYENRMLQVAACLQANTEKELRDIRAYGLKTPVCVIPNGVDLVNAETLKTETLKSERKILLFLGRLHPKKGLPNALRAWKQALHSKSNIKNSTFHEWQFVVAGWDQGGHEAELKLLCKELGLVYAETPASEFLAENPTSDLCPLSSASVIFVGPAFGDTKDALLRRATAFILPSFSEGLPMSVLEAWSYRLPVLMTEHCNIPEGFAADAALRIGTDVESIAEGMRLLACSPSSNLCSLGQNGRDLVERQFTWPQVAAQMKEVYEWVLGGGPRPCSVVL